MKRRIVVISFLTLALIGQGLAMGEIMAAELGKESLICVLPISLPMSLFVIFCLYIGMVFHMALIAYVIVREDFLQWLVTPVF